MKKQTKIILSFLFSILVIFLLLLAIPASYTPGFFGKIYTKTSQQKIEYKDLEIRMVVMSEDLLWLYPSLNYEDGERDIIKLESGKKSKIDSYSVRYFMVKNPFYKELPEDALGADDEYKIILYIKG